MSTISLSRTHDLGLNRVKALAQDWINNASKSLGLSSQITDKEGCCEISFERSGLQGLVQVTDTQFDLNIELGLMMTPLKFMIESEVERNINHLLEKAQDR